MAVVDHVHRGYKYGKKVDGGRDCDECKRLNLLEHKKARLRAENQDLNKTVTDRHQIELMRDRTKILRRRGYTLAFISRETGVSELTLWKINRHGVFPTGVKQSTLVSFTALWNRVQNGQAELPARHKRDHNAELARAAVQGLQLRGWSGRWIGEQIGLTTRHVNAIGRGEAKAVHIDTEAALIKLARKYGTTDGPSGITRARAVKQGWESTVMRDEFL